MAKSNILHGVGKETKRRKKTRGQGKKWVN